MVLAPGSEWPWGISVKNNMGLLCSTLSRYVGKKVCLRRLRVSMRLLQARDGVVGDEYFDRSIEIVVQFPYQLRYRTTVKV